MFRQKVLAPTYIRFHETFVEPFWDLTEETSRSRHPPHRHRATVKPDAGRHFWAVHHCAVPRDDPIPMPFIDASVSWMYYEIGNFKRRVAPAAILPIHASPALGIPD